MKRKFVHMYEIVSMGSGGRERERDRDNDDSIISK